MTRLKSNERGNNTCTLLQHNSVAVHLLRLYYDGLLHCPPAFTGPCDLQHYTLWVNYTCFCSRIKLLHVGCPAQALCISSACRALVSWLCPPGLAPTYLHVRNFVSSCRRKSKIPLLVPLGYVGPPLLILSAYCA